MPGDDAVQMPRQLLAPDAEYISMSRLRVAPERLDELVDAFRDRAGLVDGHDGFRGLQVWVSDRDGGEVLMVSAWTDRASFRDYMRSADHQVSHARIDGSLDAAITLERLEHWSTWDVAAR